MLSYAFSALNQGDYGSFAAEKFDNLHNLFAAILAKGIGKQLKQGLFREYLSRKENTVIMRGKVELLGTIRNRIARKHTLTCEYDELSENNLLNQILKTAVMILLKNENVDIKYKTDLKKGMLFFSDIDIIDPFSIKWTTIKFQKHNNTYQMLIGICRLLLEGMLFATEGGEYKLASFVDEQKMSHLYEKFILEYYIKEHPEVKTSASQIAWALDNGIGNMLPVMQSDVMLSKGNKVLIIDAKFYSRTMQVQYDTYTFHSNNLYQIFTYVKNKDYEYGANPHHVSGMLLYARTDEVIQPDNDYSICGNRISVKTLNLNCEFVEIAAQLDEIVSVYFASGE